MLIILLYLTTLCPPFTKLRFAHQLYAVTRKKMKGVTYQDVLNHIIETSTKIALITIAYCAMGATHVFVECASQNGKKLKKSSWGDFFYFFFKKKDLPPLWYST